MRRFGWLVLLISLGINLGLGYRLLKPWNPDHPRQGRDRTEIREDGSEGNHRQGRFDRGLETSPADSSQWRQVMVGRLERIARRLDLSPDQFQVLRTSQEANFPLFYAQRQKVEEARANLHGIISASAAEPDSVRVAIRYLGAQQARLDSLITEALLKELDILEPEQRARYLRLLPIMREEGPGRGPGSGHRFGDRRPGGRQDHP